MKAKPPATFGTSCLEDEALGDGSSIGRSSSGATTGSPFSSTLRPSAWGTLTQRRQTP